MVPRMPCAPVPPADRWAILGARRGGAKPQPSPFASGEAAAANADRSLLPSRLGDEAPLTYSAPQADQGAGSADDGECYEGQRRLRR